MRDSVSGDRSADAGGVRGLLLVALLALLHAVVIAGFCHPPSSGADHCLARTFTAAASGPSVGHCVTDGPELTSTGGSGKHHPGSGARRVNEASGSHLRHQTPSGSCGKAFGALSASAAVAASGDASPGAVRTAAAGAPPGLTVVLRC
ncbi:hypothetical protein [Streptomyces sp. NPDC048650]|uniref:hypothetical protein n=1 Tax=unclassified Streptomyces TaxID=2593676 RepID=UPI003716C488